MRQHIKTEVLVVGAGTAGTAAALQCARRGIRVALVGEDRHLGGMLTAQGVGATDGNELACFQTGLWRVFLQELYRRVPEGLHHSWVSFFSFDPLVGAGIFRDWVEQLVPRLLWLPNQQLLEVRRTEDRITGAVFTDYEITAGITIEATELGDVLALGGVPYRWGWETRAVFNEPSAPEVLADLHRQYPVQAMTWVGLLRGQGWESTAVAGPFQAALRDHDPLRFLTYGGLTPDLYMLNWPLAGNDYAVDLDRLIAGPSPRAAVFEEARAHTLAFMQYVQSVFGPNLQPAIFPQGLAPQPYLRESRRVIGRQTVTEADILPVSGGQVAALHPDTIAFGNYANDHHYPGDQWPVQPKSRRWGGRWTGTPFGIPYGCLVPEAVMGLLVTEKNISVSHIANGATRLQPLVLNLGQAAGMAAALCIERNCLPHALPVPLLQQALFTDATAPAGVVPFYNLAPSDPRYAAIQTGILTGNIAYPADGLAPVTTPTPAQGSGSSYRGQLRVVGPECYSFVHPDLGTIPLVTLEPTVVEFLAQAPSEVEVTVEGTYYPHGVWLQAVVIR